MNNTVISISPFATAKNWLLSETLPSVANNKDSSTPIKWVSKQSKANTISAFTLFTHLLTYLPKLRGDDASLPVKIFRWITGFVGIALPFVSLFRSSGSSKNKDEQLLSTNDDISPKEKIINSFKNLNHSISDSSKGQPMFPNTKDVEYRLKFHTALYEAALEKSDPLYLNTSIDKVPQEYKEKTLELRKEIVSHFVGEVQLYYRVTGGSTSDLVNTLENIIINSSEISYAKAIKKIPLSEDPIKKYCSAQKQGYIWSCLDIKYKEKKYAALEEIASMEGDPFELKVPLDKLSTEGKVFRETLILAYETEWLYIHNADAKACPRALQALSAILSKSIGNKQEDWDVGLKRKQFADWVKSIDKGSGINVERIYSLLDSAQLEYVHIIKSALEGNLEIIDSVANALEELKIADISRSKLSSDDKKTLALFFAILFSEVFTTKNSIVLKRYFDVSFNKLKEIIHDQNIFNDIERNKNFFADPDITSAPGYALSTFQNAWDSKTAINRFPDLNNILMGDFIDSIKPGSKAFNLIIGSSSTSSVVEYSKNLAAYMGLPVFFVSNADKFIDLSEKMGEQPFLIQVDYTAIRKQGIFPHQQEALDMLKEKNGIIIIRCDTISGLQPSDIDSNGSSEKGNKLVHEKMDSDALKGFRYVFTLQK